MIKVSMIHLMLRRLNPDISKKPNPFHYPKKNRLNFADSLSYGSQKFHAESLTYGAAQMDRTDPGSRQTARQAAIAASSNAS